MRELARAPGVRWEAYCSAPGAPLMAFCHTSGTCSRLSDTSIESQSEVGSLDMLSVYEKQKKKAQG